jgi:hypothetical protein
MAGFSDYLELEVLKYITGQTNDLGTAPTPFLAAGTAATDAGITEVANSNNYARISSAGKWAAPASGSVSSNATNSFPQASGSWGTITHVAIFTSGTYGAGNCLVVLALGTSKAIATNDTLEFTSGNLTITAD